MNLHATDASGRNFPTKAALKRAIANGDKVTFRSTDLFTYGQHVSLHDASLAQAIIVGPDPETSRVWYAKVIRAKRGGIPKPIRVV